jgi:hypothetical protein
MASNEQGVTDRRATPTRHLGLGCWKAAWRPAPHKQRDEEGWKWVGTTCRCLYRCRVVGGRRRANSIQMDSPNLSPPHSELAVNGAVEVHKTFRGIKAKIFRVGSARGIGGIRRRRGRRQKKYARRASGISKHPHRPLDRLHGSVRTSGLWCFFFYVRFSESLCIAAFDFSGLSTN